MTASRGGRLAPIAMTSAAGIPPPNLYGLDREGLGAVLGSLGGRPYDAGQVFRWLYARRCLDPLAWTDLPLALRERIAREARVDPGAIAARTAAADGTVKYRIDLARGGSVEAVFMLDRGRVTLCLSSQVGCALDCDFCLTAKMGFVRHLDPGEIVGQAALLQDDRALSEQRFNVVFMGMGEPLHNYDGVLAATRLLADPDGFGLSRTRITISTAGLVPGIERLAREKVRPRLAVSLNATSDELRSRLMPVNRRHPLPRLLAALRAYGEVTGERFTLEYVLLDGVNDGEAELRRLIKIVRSLPAKLNLIPFNEVPGWLPYRAPSRAKVIGIRDRLLAEGVPVSVRFSQGLEARAACGQLALLPEDDATTPGNPALIP